LLKVTLVPASIVGSGVGEACADAVPTAKFEPKIDMIDPGSTGDVYEAALGTPEMTGAEPL
jgi:hypothetical protein